jgi:lipoate-protein ligase A
MVHYGQAGAVIGRRQVVLDAAYEAHPERFVRGGAEITRRPTGGLDQQTLRE